jgi:hypothetical protein
MSETISYEPPTDEEGRYLEEGFIVSCRKCGDWKWVKDQKHKDKLEARSTVGPLAGRSRYMCRSCIGMYF